MAISDDNKRLYVDTTNPNNPIGISLWEIMKCLGYYKRDTKGNRNLGTIITNAQINKWAKCKPFRYPATSFATEEERALARKAVNQSLNISNAVNAGVPSSNADGNMYLNEIAYRAINVAGTPNWEYLRPRGITTNYDEPFRILDFDGYNHLAKQPFDTYCSIINGSSITQLPPAGQTEIKVNRFVTNGLRFSLVMNNTGVDISMSDLLYGNNADFFFFVAEKYENTGRGQGTNYYERRPDKILKATSSITAVEQHGGSSIIDYTFDANDDGKQTQFVIGVNEYTSNADDAPLQGRGLGFIAPYFSSAHPFLYTIRQEYYGVFDMRQENGYYLPSLNGGFQSFSLKDYNDLTMKGTESDKVGISLKLRRRTDNYYITGSEAYTVPSGKVSYKFRLINQQSGVTIVGTLSDATMTQNLTHVVIPIGSNDEWETVYIRFDNFLPNRGDSIQYGILEISKDNGQTWTQINASSMGDGFIEPECDGSSIKLYLTRK